MKLKKDMAVDPAFEQEIRIKKAKRRRIGRIVDRIFGFFLATGIVFACAGLALGLIVTRGPSTALRDAFVMTFLETRRFRFVNNIFLSDAEISYVYNSHTVAGEVEDFDASLITIASKENDGASQTNHDGSDAYGLIDEDGDGIIKLDIKGSGYAGHMLVVLDPSRVICGKPDSYGGVGLTLEEMCQKYDAVGGINAGGFLDVGGSGLGGIPQGITIVDGVCYQESTHGLPVAGFDENNILHVGYKDFEEVSSLGLRDCASFGPILVMNGQISDSQFVNSGVNPRTAIGQRADGAVLMLVIDGRQTHSIGATYSDLAEIMLDHGAVTALNMDGGSSTCMYFEGEYVNKCSAYGGRPRPLPTSFLIMKEG